MAWEARTGVANRSPARDRGTRGFELTDLSSGLLTEAASKPATPSSLVQAVQHRDNLEDCQLSALARFGEADFASGSSSVVERLPSKQDAEGSNPFSRSKLAPLACSGLSRIQLLVARGDGPRAGGRSVRPARRARSAGAAPTPCDGHGRNHAGRPRRFVSHEAGKQARALENAARQSTGGTSASAVPARFDAWPAARHQAWAGRAPRYVSTEPPSARACGAAAGARGGATGVSVSSAGAKAPGTELGTQIVDVGERVARLVRIPAPAGRAFECGKRAGADCENQRDLRDLHRDRKSPRDHRISIRKIAGLPSTSGGPRSLHGRRWAARHRPRGRC